MNSASNLFLSISLPASAAVRIGSYLTRQGLRIGRLTDRVFGIAIGRNHVCRSQMQKCQEKQGEELRLHTAKLVGVRIVMSTNRRCPVVVFNLPRGGIGSDRRVVVHQVNLSAE